MELDRSELVRSVPGAKISLALVAATEACGSRSNIGITARETRKKQCRRVLRDFMNDTPMKNPSCYERAHFGDPAGKCGDRLLISRAK